jgi:hypothetical protein
MPWYEGTHREQIGGTRVEFALRIDPGFWVPGRIARLLHETVMKRTVADLKRAAEGG